MRTSEFMFSWQGEEIRVVVVGDVLALPSEHWSCGGFGSHISVEWLLHEARLPGLKSRRAMLADCLVRALKQHHEGGEVSGDRSDHAYGPQVRCGACKGHGFVPAVRDDGKAEPEASSV